MRSMCLLFLRRPTAHCLPCVAAHSMPLHSTSTEAMTEPRISPRGSALINYQWLRFSCWTEARAGCCGPLVHLATRSRSQMCLRSAPIFVGHRMKLYHHAVFVRTHASCISAAGKLKRKPAHCTELRGSSSKVSTETKVQLNIPMIP